MARCPNCGRFATFTEHSHEWTETHGLDCGPYEHCYQEWLSCDACGCKTDHEELMRERELESEHDPYWESLIEMMEATCL